MSIFIGLLFLVPPIFGFGCLLLFAIPGAVASEHRQQLEQQTCIPTITKPT